MRWSEDSEVTRVADDEKRTDRKRYFPKFHRRSTKKVSSIYYQMSFSFLAVISIIAWKRRRNREKSNQAARRRRAKAVSRQTPLRSAVEGSGMTVISMPLTRGPSLVPVTSMTISPEVFDVQLVVEELLSAKPAVLDPEFE